MRFPPFFIWFLIVISPLCAQSQLPTDTQPLNEHQRRLQILERQRITDSLERVLLLRQIKELTSPGADKATAADESVRKALKKLRIDSLRNETPGFPVVAFFNDTLFHIYSRLGSFTAEDRAQVISERIRNLAGKYFAVDSLHVKEAETTTDILYEDAIIMSVSEDDAIWNRADRNELANHYRNIIASAVGEFKAETNWITLLKQTGLALLVIVITYFVLKYVSRLFRWLAVRIVSQENRLIKGIAIRNYTLFDAHRQVRALLLANNVIKWLVVLMIIYIALPILFGIFPWTENFAHQLFGYVLNPLRTMALAFWNYLPDLITIIVIVFVFRYVIKLLRFIKIEIERGNLQIPGFYVDWANPTYHIVRVLVFAFMIVVIFPYLPGSDSPIFKGVSVFLGFLFTFGSAGSLSNLIAGLVLTYMRLFRIGDRVKIGEVAGDVVEKSLLVTRVRTIKNELVSIPNSTVMNSHTINYSSDATLKGLILHTTVTIGYDVPWQQVQKALIAAALKTENILDEPAPFVLQTSLDDFYVSYQLNGYTKAPNQQALTYSDLHKNILDECNAAGIEIMSPHYTAARDGNHSTIPKDFLPKGYTPPGFNLFNIGDNKMAP